MVPRLVQVLPEFVEYQTEANAPLMTNFEMLTLRMKVE
jgi:hypothetical protein